MLCKHCGMDSATTDECSWCHRELSGAAQADVAASVTAEETPPVSGEANQAALQSGEVSAPTEPEAEAADAGFAFRPAPRHTFASRFAGR